MGISHEHDMLLVGDFSARASHEHSWCGYLDAVCGGTTTATTTVPHSALRVTICKSVISNIWERR